MTRQSSRILLASIYLLLVLANTSSSPKLTKIQLRNLQTVNTRSHGHAHGHNEHFVDADAHTHAVELGKCEGSTLELTGDASLEVHNADNAHMFLVTNVELTSCEEIEDFHCHHEATVCLTWEAHEEQAHHLHYNEFPNGEVFLYVKPDDSAHDVSLTVKLTPEGAQSHEASHHAHSATGHDEQHVDDDSAYHAVELHACEGSALDIPNGDHLFDVSVVSNAKRYLITDEELTTCDEIKHLQCKPGSHFCQIYDAHAQEMVLLNHDQFPHKIAHFYVEPQDPNHPSSVNVKLVPAETDEHGNVHAPGDHSHDHDHEHDGESHHSNIDEQHVENDGHVHSITLHECTGSLIQLPGDATLTVHNVDNAKRYLLTNVPFESCEQIKAFVCNRNATYCHEWDPNLEDEEIHLQHKMFSNGEAHLYAEPVDAHEPVEVNIKVVPVGDQHGHEAAGHHGHQEKFVEVDSHTHAVEIEKCTGVTLDLKGDTVLVAQNADNAQAFMVTNIELDTCEEIEAFECPADAEHCSIFSADEEHDVMLKHDEFPSLKAYFYAQPHDSSLPVAVNVKLTTVEKWKEEHHDKAPETIASRTIGFIADMEKLILRGVIATLLTVGIIAICYRRYLNKHGRAPFSVPAWCPSFCFPKSKDSEGSEKFITREANKQDNQELQAGMIRQVEV